MYVIYICIGCKQNPNYSSSNRGFEHSTGLDWFPSDLEGVHQYQKPPRYLEWLSCENENFQIGKLIEFEAFPQLSISIKSSWISRSNFLPDARQGSVRRSSFASSDQVRAVRGLTGLLIWPVGAWMMLRDTATTPSGRWSGKPYLSTFAAQKCSELSCISCSLRHFCWTGAFRLCGHFPHKQSWLAWNPRKFFAHLLTGWQEKTCHFNGDFINVGKTMP